MGCGVAPIGKSLYAWLLGAFLLQVVSKLLYVWLLRDFLVQVVSKLWCVWLLKEFWLQVVFKVVAVCLLPEFWLRAVSKLCAVRLLWDFWLQVVSKLLDVWLLQVLGCNSFSEVSFIRDCSSQIASKLVHVRLLGVPPRLAYMVRSVKNHLCLSQFLVLQNDIIFSEHQSGSDK